MESTERRSTEEAYQLARSTKKMKRGTDQNPVQNYSIDFMVEDIGMNSPEAIESDISRVSESMMDINQEHDNPPRRSFRDMVQQNNPHLSFVARVNPAWENTPYCDVSDDDEAPEDDDPNCPTILISAKEKRQLWYPWRNALIIKMFDKGIGFMQLKRGLKKKWLLKGDFPLIDIGFEYYVTRFMEQEDYEYVLTQGP